MPCIAFLFEVHREGVSVRVSITVGDGDAACKWRMGAIFGDLILAGVCDGVCVFILSLRQNNRWHGGRALAFSRGRRDNR